VLRILVQMPGFRTFRKQKAPTLLNQGFYNFIPKNLLEPSNILNRAYEKILKKYSKNTHCKLSPIKHFNDMPTKFSFNEMRL
jgi:hypothetical protein